jgi:hypothetical protein
MNSLKRLRSEEASSDASHSADSSDSLDPYSGDHVTSYTKFRSILKGINKSTPPEFIQYMGQQLIYMEKLLTDYERHTFTQDVVDGISITNCAMTNRDVFEKHVFRYLDFTDHVSFGQTNRYFMGLAGIGRHCLKPPPLPCLPPKKSLAWRKVVRLPGVHIADFSKLYRCISGVVDLRFRGNTRMKSLGNIQCLESLHTIKIDSRTVQTLHGLNQCKKLSHLELCNISDIKYVNELDGCNQLTTLKIDSCNFMCLDGIIDLKALKTLEVRHCRRLIHVETLSANIDTLTLAHLEIMTLDGLDRCKHLTKFTMDSCRRVVQMSPLSECLRLEVLSITNNDNFGDFRWLSPCPALTYLTVNQAFALASFDGLQNSNLRLLTIDAVPRLDTIESIKCFRNLRSLSIGMADSLESIELTNFDNLDFFRLYRCPNVRSVIFSGCKSLETIRIQTCIRFSDDGTLGNCFGLRDLFISGSQGELDMSTLLRCKYLTSIKVHLCSNVRNTEYLWRNGPTFKLFDMNNWGSHNFINLCD